MSARTASILLAVAIAIVLALLSPGAARGQATLHVCSERAPMLERLREQYAEVVVSRAVTGNGAMVERTQSPQGKWTLLISFGDGTACVLAVGDVWESVTPAPKGRRS